MIRLGICNELFEGWEFGDVCRTVKELGYELELVALQSSGDLGTRSFFSTSNCWNQTRRAARSGSSKACPAETANPVST